MKVLNSSKMVSDAVSAVKDYADNLDISQRVSKYFKNNKYLNYRGGGYQLEDLRTDRILLWNDEFDFIDTNKWALAGDFYESYNYTHYMCTSETLSCKDSVLTLSGYKFDDTHYRCPLLICKNGFRHGLIEVKAKFELTPYIFGGVWSTTTPTLSQGHLLAWYNLDNNIGELDIAEPDAWANTTKLCTTLHYPDASGAYTNYRDFEFVNDNKYHIYGTELTDDYLYIYFDRELVASRKLTDSGFLNGSNIFNQHGLYLILNQMMYTEKCSELANMTVGKKTNYYIDWIRVYGREGETEHTPASSYCLIDKNGVEYPLNSTDGNYFPTMNVESNGGMSFNFKFYPEESIIIPKINGIIIPDSGENLLINCNTIWNNVTENYIMTVLSDIGEYRVYINFGTDKSDKIVKDFLGVSKAKKSMTSTGDVIMLEKSDTYYVFGETATLNIMLLEAVPDDNLPDDYKYLFNHAKENYMMEYFIEFISGATATTLNIIGAKNSLVPEANKKYFLHIMDGWITATSADI